MGLYLYNGDLYGDNKTITAAPDLNVIIGKSVIRL